MIQPSGRNKKMTKLGEELIEAMEEMVAHSKGEKKLHQRVVKSAPAVVDVAAIRKHIGLSQREFAERYGFRVRAIQEWEQHRRQPERAARILLKIIEKRPEAVEEVLELA
jgi:putative transcriptional regulator